MKRKIDISIVLLIITVAVTIFLFFFLSKEENRNKEFAFTLGYTIFLEILFYTFIYTTRLNSKNIMGTTYSVLGTVLVYYLIFGAITLLIFNIFLLELISSKWYYTVVIINTLVGVIATGFVLKLNNSVVAQTEGSELVTSSHSSILQEIKYLESTYKSTLSRKGLNESFESNYGSILEKLINKLRFVNPKVFAERSVQSRLSDQITLIDEQVKELQKPNIDGNSVQKQILDIVEDTITYINTLN